jgi:ribose transport system permease protein
MLIAMIAVVAVLQGNFFAPSSLRNSLLSYTPLILLGMGQAIVLLAGGLDLSAGSAMALILCVMAKVMESQETITGVYALLLGAGVAAVTGLVNGISVGYLRLPPIVATFATSYMWLGIGLFVMPSPGGSAANWIRAFYDISLVEGAPPWLLDFGKAVPTAIFLIAGGCVMWYCVLRARTGRYIYAVGSDRLIAFYSGINTSRTIMKAYMMNAFFVLLCALYFMGQNQSASARLGDPMTLQCIAAAVIGGVAITGGKGNAFLAIAGAIILTMVNKIIYLMNVPTAYQVLVSGVVIIAAIAGPSIIAMKRDRTRLMGGS